MYVMSVQIIPLEKYKCLKFSCFEFLLRAKKEMLLLWSEKIKGAKIFVGACVKDLSVLTACLLLRMSRVCLCRGEMIESVLLD